MKKNFYTLASALIIGTTAFAATEKKVKIINETGQDITLALHFQNNTQRNITIKHTKSFDTSIHNIQEIMVMDSKGGMRRLTRALLENQKTFTANSICTMQMPPRCSLNISME
ncbi:MAG TPA: hypothetical protein VEK38_00800 [Candidatus Bathyarchaeia archaeon]|nr:hypothetical protein [Candidatus Bathyarchaeia archaeon]